MAKRAAISFLKAAERAISTGKTDEYEALVTESCDCRRLVTSLKEDYEDGRRVEKFKLTVQRVKVTDIKRDRASVQVQHDQTAYRIVNSDGVIQEEIPEKSYKEELLLTRVQGEWLIGQVVAQ